MDHSPGRTKTALLKRVSLLLAALSFTIAVAQPAQSQPKSPCPPVSQRGGQEFGCFMIRNQDLGTLPNAPVFWHIDSFPTLAAAQAARTSLGTVVSFHDKIWLFTITGERWRSNGSTHVAKIGPLPLVPADRYAAVYLEADLKPGMSTQVHRHPGVETWYTMAGTTCVETPKGKLVQHAGGSAIIVPAGLPMKLTATGNSVRQGFALILQDASKPWVTVAHDWTPKGLCVE